jgi:nicotinate-nucleotide adenylyltransferase
VASSVNNTSSAELQSLQGLRLALLGGTFNPPHLGHLLVAQEAHFSLGVEHVIFLPAAQNPLKPETSFATAGQRLELTRLSVAGDARFAVDSAEVEAGGLSYSVDTLRRYVAQGVRELYFLVGADAALDLSRWREIADYRELCTLAIYNRPGSADFSQGLPAELKALDLRWQYLPVPQVDISSTEVRRRIAAGEPFEYMVPEAVAEYIRAHQLGHPA